MTPVLVIAGGDISDKLPYVRAGCGCPALIPVNTRPLASYVMEAYGTSFDLHLFVDDEFLDEVRKELPPRKHGFSLHGIGPSRGVVDTLRQAIGKIPRSSEVIVNLVTTIPTAIPDPDEILVAHQPAHTTTEWSAVHASESSLSFFPKGTVRPADALAFTGVFRLSSAVLTESISAAKTDVDLLSVVEAASQRHLLKTRRIEWIDCGHETNYYRSRASLINSRSFNRLRVDERRGTITKSSDNKLKLARETSYLEMLPPSLRILFPRLVGISGGSNHVDSYEMEYYGYPNLAEYQLYWNLSKESWWRCFDLLNDVLHLFREHPASVGSTAYKQFHWEKTVTRIEQYLGSLSAGEREAFTHPGGLKLNEKSIAPLSELLETAGSIIDRGYDENAFAVFHGDFCFNNILFDVGSGVIRLIDPRGSFGDGYPGIYGDHRYDLAKLAHSTVGHYDYFVNGLFDVWSPSTREFHLQVVLRHHSDWLDEMTDWLVSAQNADPTQIRVMTGLLFLSMCPLHADDPARQRALFLRGMELLHQTIN